MATNELDVYGVILEAAFAEVQNNHATDAAFSAIEQEYEEMGIGPDTTFDGYVIGLYDLYENAGAFDMQDDELVVDVTNTAYASVRLYRMMYNMAMAEVVKNSIDEVLDGKNTKYADLISDLGISEEEKPELKEKLKAYVDDRVEGRFTSKSDQKLAAILKGNMTRPHAFVRTGFDYVFAVNNLLTTGHPAEDVFEMETMGEEFYQYPLYIPDYMKEATKIILDEIKESNKKITKEDWLGEIHDTASGSIDVDVIYRKGETVNPVQFLKHFNKGYDSLTAEDKQWATKVFNNIAGGFKEQGDFEGDVSIYDFMADGTPVVSNDDKREIQKELKNEDDMHCKLVASMLSGKKVGVIPKASEKAWYINPLITTQPTEKPKGFLSRLWQKFKSLFDFSHTKEKIQSMNDKFRVNADMVKNVREKTTFDDMMKQQAKTNPLSYKYQGEIKGINNVGPVVCKDDDEPTMGH